MMNQPVASLVSHCHVLSQLVIFLAGLDIAPIKPVSLS
jgi:hypothetical protein